MPAAIKACFAHSAAARSLGTLSRSTVLRSHGHGLSISTAAFFSHQKPSISVKRTSPNPTCVPFRVAAAAMSTSTARPGLKFSAGSDEATLSEKLQTLLSPASADGASGRWTLIANGQGLERSFKFKTFAKTWDFMTAVALQCKLKNHHPEWSNVYNTTFIRWTTHSPPGLSALDVELAALCDGIAKDFGEIVAEDGDSCSVGRQLADTVATNAGDCCVPKTKPKA
ncbi:pterin 4 alpha carbinolamine dehydratase-domain-containing protein [Pestalotiopsis sp. NC0098]|nr:pterin 4 alpha carbinolamine dehydratase-domain-containing protein [Pestalotiopsis sp. NC0098]